MKSSKLSVAVVAAFLVGVAAWAADTASISGKIAFDGTAPKQKKIKTDADPKCAEMHADDPLKTEEVLVNENGTLKNVFVYVKSGLQGKTYEPPKTPVELDQKGCHYVPHVFGMMAKQPLKIVNADDTLHNIHAMPTKSKEFNVGQPNKGMETTAHVCRAGSHGAFQVRRASVDERVRRRVGQPVLQRVGRRWRVFDQGPAGGRV